MSKEPQPQHQLFRTVRILEYVGTREWLDSTLMRNSVKGVRVAGDGEAYIREAYFEFPVLLGDEPEVLKAVRDAYERGLQAGLKGKDSL